MRVSGRAGTHYVPILDRSRGRLRIPVDILAEALRQASNEGLASPIATVRMETGGLIDNGRLDPVATSLLRVITSASMMVVVEVQLDGDDSLTTIWATPSRAVISSSLDPELVDIEPVRLGRLPETLADLILLQSPQATADRPIVVPTGLLAAADAVRDEPGAFCRRLVSGGVAEDDAERLLAFEARATRRWRITSTWATPDGQQMAELRGLDAGETGQWLMEMTGGPGGEGQMTFSPQGDGEILRALRAVLPRRWVGQPLNPRSSGG